MQPFDQIDFKLVFNKLLEINERSVEQLIHFKEMLKTNNEQFDDIINKINIITEKLKTFETNLEILKNRKFIDKVDDIDNRTEDEFKNLTNWSNDLKKLVSDIYELQRQFKDRAKEEIKEINSILNSVSKTQESLRAKNGILADDIKEIKHILDDFNKRVTFENRLNKVISVIVAAMMMVTAFFTLFK